MFWPAGFGFSEAMNLSVEDFADSLLPILGAVSSPGGDNQADVWPPLSEGFVVAGADGFGLGFHDLWVGRAETVGVHHEQAGESPVFCKADAASDGGVVVGFVGGRRIESDEHALVQFALEVPAAPECVAIFSASREFGSVTFFDVDHVCSIENLSVKCSSSAFL